MGEFHNEEKDPSNPSHSSTPHASLAAIGAKLKALNLFEPIHRTVKILQKTLRYTPTQKLYQLFVGLLMGIGRIVEINERLRADPVLQKAFGLSGCAEQSVIQETLSACTEANVKEFHEALDKIFQTHSRGFHHDYTRSFQLLDIDLTGQPCGRKAEFASKGYFANQRNRRGRQLGRVLATRYQEVVIDRLYPGSVQLNKALPELLAAAESTLQLDAAKKKRTILRIDSGGGTLEDLNGALGQGYQIHAKDYSSKRAEKLAQSVKEWVEDPRDPNRRFGWVTTPATEYVRPVKRIAVQCKTSKGEWKSGVLISSLSEEEVIQEAALSPEQRNLSAAALLAYVYFYDQRGGACETEFKGDKQGLGMTKRNKKSFAAQQILVALGALAHNVLIWSKDWLLPTSPVLEGYGIKRLVRDLLSIQGSIEFSLDGEVRRIFLNPYSRLARHVVAAFQALLAPFAIRVILGET